MKGISHGQLHRVGAVAALFLLAACSGALPTPSAEANMDFTQTGAQLYGPFETYWKANGGLQRFGMPLTGVFDAGNGYAAQWFERAVLLYNPANPDPFKVQVQDLGWIISAPRCADPAFARVSLAGSGQYFAATGHTLSGSFLAYWTSHGGLSAFGYPLSEPFVERNKANGLEYLVQYFERARFEQHLEAAGTANQMQLGLIGAEALASQGGAKAFANQPVPTFYPSTAQPVQSRPGVYPKMGHAPDYSWVAGRVSDVSPLPRGMERPTLPPQVHSGPGPVYAPPPPGSGPITYPNGVTVGHATHSDTSPPLRSITPLPAMPECQALAADTFVPSGRGWSAFGLKDGDYVLLFGHLTGSAPASTTFSQARSYVVDRMTRNP